MWHQKSFSEDIIKHLLLLELQNISYDSELVYKVPFSTIKCGLLLVISQTLLAYVFALGVIIHCN